MSKFDRLLSRGISFAKAGREQEARMVLQAVIREEPGNQLAWGWYVQTFSNEDERIQAFEAYLRVFPNDQRAIRLQAGLLKDQNQRWKQLTNDAIQEIDFQKEDHNQQIKEKTRIIRRTRIGFALVCLFLIGVIYFASVAANNKVEQLSAQLEVSQKEYSTLFQAYQTLREQYSALQASYSELSNAYASLEDQFNALLNDYQALSDRYAALEGDYEWLDQISVQPPYILTNGRKVTMAFYKLDGTILYWDVPFEALEKDLRRGNTQRSVIANFLWNRKLSLYNSNTDETYRVVDIRPFVDSSYFTDVMYELYADSNSDDEFIREVWNIVAQLTAYTGEIEETPRYPYETLLAGGGDCEDTSILLASMLDAAPVNWKIEFVYMDAENPTSPQNLNHVAVRVSANGNDYLIESTSKYEMEPYYSGVSGWFYDIDE